MMQNEREELRQERYEDVWDALEETPEAAADMRARSDLIISLQQQIAAWGMTRTDAAKRLGISQSRLDDLLHGRISNFSLGALVDLGRT